MRYEGFNDGEFRESRAEAKQQDKTEKQVTGKHKMINRELTEKK